MNSIVKSTALAPVVEFRHVTKIWNPGTDKAFKALEDVTFIVDDLPDKGEFITILGPSGCGKSTMLNLLAGFQEVFPPTEGEILVRSKPIDGPGIDRGMVFQKYSSFPHLTVEENIKFGLNVNRSFLDLSESEISDRVSDWIHKTGLDHHRAKYPRQLSGGQQQRVALARTLVLKPRIILMDEPFSALDEPTRLEMQSLLVELWTEVQATVFLVTHSIVESVYLGDRIWIFSPAPGKIIREFNSIYTVDSEISPGETQKKPEFLNAVEEVSCFFQSLDKPSNRK